MKARVFKSLLIVAVILSAVIAFSSCKWFAPDTHTVTFVAHGQVFETRRVVDGETVDRPPNPVIVGGTFSGWFLGAELFDFSTPIRQNITLSAGFSTDPLVRFVCVDGGALFDVNGNIISSVSVRPRTPVSRPPHDPYLLGHDFLGWYADVDFSQSFDFSLDVYQDTNIYARFGKLVDISANIFFESFGNAFVGEARVDGVGSHVVGSEVTLVAVLPQGIFVTAWYRNNVLISGAMGSTLGVTVGENAAVYSIVVSYGNTVVLSFKDINGGTLTAEALGYTAATSTSADDEVLSFTTEIGQPITISASLHMIDDRISGYEFLGWYTAQGVLKSSESSFEYTPTGQLTEFFARFELRDFNLDFSLYVLGMDISGGAFNYGNAEFRVNGVISSTFTIRDTILLSATVDSQNSQFLGFYLGENILTTAMQMDISGQKLLLGGADTLPLFAKFIAYSNIHVDYFIFDSNNVIVGLKGDAPTDIIIPAFFDGRAVTTLNALAFFGRGGISHIHIPATLTTITGGNPFMGMSDLQFISVDSTNNSFANDIGGVLFNSTMTSLISFPAASTMEEFTAPKTLTRVEASAFYSAQNLEVVNMTSPLMFIGNSAFAESSIVEATVISSANSFVVERFAFLRCRSLTTLNISALGANNAEIQSFALSNLNSLTNLTLDGIRILRANSLTSIPLLTVITLPATLHTFENRAFYSTGIERVNVDTGSNNFGASDGVLYRLTNGQLTTLLYVPESRIGIVNVAESTTQIVPFAFNNARYVTAILFGSSRVTTIGYRAFSGMSSLHTIDLSATMVTAISDSTFFNCINLTSIVLPNTVVSIGEFAFAFNRGLTSISLGTSLRTIAATAFTGVSALTSITLPATLTNAGDAFISGNTRTPGVFHIFQDTTSLVNIHSENTSPTTNAYWSNNGILYHGTGSQMVLVRAPSARSGIITLTQPAVFIGRYAFMASMASEVEFAGMAMTALRDIGAYAFQFSGITRMIIPSGVTSIGPEAFMGTRQLTTLIIPANSNLGEIGFKAFAGSAFEQVTLPNRGGNNLVIGQYAFSDNSNLRRVHAGPNIPNLTLSGGRSGVFDGHNANFRIIVPQNALSAFRNAQGWREYSSFIHAS